MAWTTWLDAEGSIRVRIEGYLDTVEGEKTIQSLVGLLREQLDHPNQSDHPDHPRDVVFEVSAMTGYRRGVRASWQEVLLEHRGALQRFVLIGGNSVVRMSLNVIAMALGIPLIQLELPDQPDPSEAEPASEPDAPVRRVRARSGSRPSAASLRQLSLPLSRPRSTASSSSESAMPAMPTKSAMPAMASMRREQAMAHRRSREDSRPNQ